jgi:hypothetical protein
VIEDLSNRSPARATTARADLLAALEGQGLSGYRASRELAWVVFPPAQEGGDALEVLHVPHLDLYRVVARRGRPRPAEPARLLGEFETADGAAECVAGARPRARA